jgi:hypothetical protein
MMPGVLEELLVCLRRLGERLPGVRIKDLTVHFEVGEPLIVPYALITIAAAAAWPELKSGLEEDIWDALGEDQKLTAKEIASAVGVTNDEHLRRTLSDMRKRRLLTGGRGEMGYAQAGRPT